MTNAFIDGNGEMAMNERAGHLAIRLEDVIDDLVAIIQSGPEDHWRTFSPAHDEGAIVRIELST